MTISTTMILGMTIQAIWVITLVRMIAQILDVASFYLREYTFSVLVFTLEFGTREQLLKSGFSLHFFYLIGRMEKLILLFFFCKWR
jgi:hypothetical protein